MSRTVIGYHGTTLNIAEKVVGREISLRPSNNPGDWLGRGIYFFEDGPQRALTWARRFTTPLNKPAVLKFNLKLDDCLDLVDSPFCIELRQRHPEFEDFERRVGIDTEQPGLVVQDGKVYTTASSDMNYRTRPPVNNFRDRAFVNWFAVKMMRDGVSLSSVRGIFLQGRGLCNSSHLFDWGHIQIAVRNPDVMTDPEIVKF